MRTTQIPRQQAAAKPTAMRAGWGEPGGGISCVRKLPMLCVAGDGYQQGDDDQDHTEERLQPYLI
jgi:hypothetical protein